MDRTRLRWEACVDGLKRRRGAKAEEADIIKRRHRHMCHK